MNLVNSTQGNPSCECGCTPRPQTAAMASIPAQDWQSPYEPAKALTQGTIFPILDKPFFATDSKLGGGRHG